MKKESQDLKIKKSSWKAKGILPIPKKVEATSLKNLHNLKNINQIHLCHFIILIIFWEAIDLNGQKVWKVALPKRQFLEILS